MTDNNDKNNPWYFEARGDARAAIALLMAIFAIAFMLGVDFGVQVNNG